MEHRTSLATRLVLSLLGVSALVQAQTGGVLLANESFDYSQAWLHGAAGGSGWARAWEVQNGNTAIPGYNLLKTQPLSGTNAAQSVGYAVGGMNWQNSGRAFDTAGAFASNLTNGLIGQPGTSLYMSVLLRQDQNSTDELSLTLHPGSNPAWQVNSPGVAVGYFGGNRYWSLKLNGAVVPTKAAIVTGKAALLVVRLDFAASGGTSKASLWVNPSASTLPASADAIASSTNSIAFASAAYYGGTVAGRSSIDEIRVATAYTALAIAKQTAPAPPASLTATPGDRQVTLTWTASSGATSYKIYRSTTGTASLQATVTVPGYTQTGLTNGTAYTYYVTALNAAGTSLPSGSVTVVPRGAAPTAHPTLGTNLSELKDYTRSWPFVDAFKMARPWISQQQGAAWGTGPALQLDANGWIKSLAAGQYAETIVFDNGLDDTAHYPTGNYTLLYDGEGTIAFDLGTATIVSQTPGRMVVNVPGSPYGIFLMVTATNPANPIRNIRFILPGFESTYATQPFNPLFLSRLDGYKALRFMEWQLTNGSTLQNWADRPKVADYTYVLRGVPLEVLIQLANQTNLPAWFNLPAQATDDFARQTATLIRQQLKAGLKFYVEYSNETWNGTFSQRQYVGAMGQQLGLSSDPTLAAAYYTSYRSAQIFQIFRSVLGTSSPMVRVIAAQAANSWLSDQMLNFQNSFAQADALAIAPYFNCSDTAAGGFGMLGDPATAAIVDGMTVDTILDIQLQHINGCAYDQMTSNGAVARKYGLLMVGYEGGQSLVGFSGAENDATMTALFKAANRHPRMNDLYSRYLTNWVNAGGDLLLHFNDVGPWTRYGSWGALEFLDQDPATSAKYQALHTFAVQHP